MEVIEAILALLGLGGLSLTLVWLLFAVFNLLWAILSAVLATRRGRNPWNWFFLTCFYGIFGLLFLACSKTINQGEYRESDTLAKVLWWVFLIPTTIIVTLSIIISIEKRKDDELTRKVLEDMKREEQMYHQDKNGNISTFNNTSSYSGESYKKQSINHDKEQEYHQNHDDDYDTSDNSISNGEGTPQLNTQDFDSGIGSNGNRDQYAPIK